MIKKEIISVIPTNEIQPDLSSEFLTYANLICLANAQILILEIASIKGLAFQLQAQLAKEYMNYSLLLIIFPKNLL